MEFRSPTVAAQQNAKAIAYLTKNLRDPEMGRKQVEVLIEELGNAIDRYPDWHPLLTAPPRNGAEQISSLSQVKVYEGIDHTTEFVRGFVTCPYPEDGADRLVDVVSQVPGLQARRLEQPLYSDNAHPVVVVATNVSLEADGTIRSRDALVWFAQQTAGEASGAQVAETWWNIRSNILGSPHGSRSSLFVNQHTGVHMRKILETMNASGMFGPIKESSLDMLPRKKRDAISDLLIRTAVNNWDRTDGSFIFEMRGETCKATLRDTWNDNQELSVRVEIGKYDLYVSGFFYPSEKKITHTDPRGKRELAEKFL
ncbi:hypothetical protein [Mesorhizobium sp.]|uniref:hypothetical protein n=1 Tax=Mesorhizobium sp. TaxID=1871066 RepID=UPI000FE86452|nr:hypothetical protein [Mesorhizobium sp.]RWI07373.1 MAG: hypothetical protein EOQ90_24160 [Mesorhizobium sp.]RWK51650.1 MAG: hypothetical protein EOR48_24925 [Mesorhizobium sp.]RWK95224.1 MAG: hypothetical protein EOR53_14595 [Mesorhizobium sp.]RWL23227.1 MAG: hypothetical protein EOR57_04080 [Mesorhizobium sp.]TIP41251.1 MAG: hypothetical protein E5X62_25655 [Mesorhizobium sp.]